MNIASLNFSHGDHEVDRIDLFVVKFRFTILRHYLVTNKTS